MVNEARVGIVGTRGVIPQEVATEVKNTMLTLFQHKIPTTIPMDSGVAAKAIEVALTYNPTLDGVEVLLPAEQHVYADHLRRAGVNPYLHQKDRDEYLYLLQLLQQVREANPAAIVEIEEKTVDGRAYYRRDCALVEKVGKLKAIFVGKRRVRNTVVENAIKKDKLVQIVEFQDLPQPSSQIRW